jgi:hypothetical protein
MGARNDIMSEYSHPASKEGDLRAEIDIFA